ncbi:hypothetical protein PDN45_06280 [Bacillus cereus]|nr:hypothetical protein [Bacillus cereus]MDA2459761.1 hypothetical protein [Bacillus cereus]
MDAIVLDLQKEAYDSKSDVVALLRKAYVVARKLKLTEFGNWINEELNGYQSYEKTPEYRNVSGLLKARNPYHGLIPVLMDSSELADIFTNRKLVQPISEIESFANGENNIMLTFLPEQRKMITKATGVETEYFVEVTRNQVGNIVDNVRNIVLDWSLNLEEDGILGENMSFSSEEKEKAQNNSSITNIFHGNATGVQIQHQTSNSNQSMQQNNLDIQKIEELLKTIKENLGQIDLDSGQKATINTNIEMIEKQKQLSNPNPVIIKEGFSTIRNVLEGVTGSLIASGIIHHLGLFLS